ncbi:hypothetical protein KC355_g56 [Hortaea werneckii]|nr:hypothetical protein KC355_g56 [Hortaea werneckii]
MNKNIGDIRTWRGKTVVTASFPGNSLFRVRGLVDKASVPAGYINISTVFLRRGSAGRGLGAPVASSGSNCGSVCPSCYSDGQGMVRMCIVLTLQHWQLSPLATWRLICLVFTPFTLLYLYPLLLRVMALRSRLDMDYTCAMLHSIPYNALWMRKDYLCPERLFKG